MIISKCIPISYVSGHYGMSWPLSLNPMSLLLCQLRHIHPKLDPHLLRTTRVATENGNITARTINCSNSSSQIGISLYDYSLSPFPGRRTISHNPTEISLSLRRPSLLCCVLRPISFLTTESFSTLQIEEHGNGVYDPLSFVMYPNRFLISLTLKKIVENMHCHNVHVRFPWTWCRSKTSIPAFNDHPQCSLL